MVRLDPIEYKSPLQSFLLKGVRFRKFEEFNVDQKCQVILRHDSDFSADMAVQMAA
jgi:hypothetical protein